MLGQNGTTPGKLGHHLGTYGTNEKVGLTVLLPQLS